MPHDEFHGPNDVCCPVVELRQYVMQPGQRDTLIGMFEDYFLESQEADGIHVIGQYRVDGEPDRFTWLRGFASMESRKRSLSDFYYGPVWQKHKNEANPTMADSDDVLLLRPIAPGWGFPVPVAGRAPLRVADRPASRVVATIHYLREPLKDDDVAFFIKEMAPALATAGAPPIACLTTEYAENTFPALPVRVGEHVLVCFSRFDTLDGYRSHARARAASSTWQNAIAPELLHRSARDAQDLVLEPGARSELR
jgi:hypothetical protein